MNSMCYNNTCFYRENEVRVIIIRTESGHPTTQIREATYEKTIYLLFHNHDFTAMFR